MEGISSHPFSDATELMRPHQTRATCASGSPKVGPGAGRGAMALGVDRGDHLTGGVADGRGQVVLRVVHADLPAGLVVGVGGVNARLLKGEH